MERMSQSFLFIFAHFASFGGHSFPSIFSREEAQKTQKSEWESQ
jgi:hypothetical protein